MLRRSGILSDFVARQWAEHGEPGNVVAHAIGFAVSSALLTLLLAKVHVPLWGGAEVALGWLYGGGLVVAYALLDPATAALTACALALTTGAWRGQLYGEWSSGPVDLVLPLLGLVPAALLVRAGHQVYRDVQHEQLARGRGRPWLRMLLTALVGFPAFLLLLLLQHGYRPLLRARLAERGRQLFTPWREAPWRNWAGTAECTPCVLFYPRSVDEIVAIVLRARHEGRRIRVVGAAYSWEALVPTEEFLVCLCLMNQVRLDLSSPSRPRAIIEGGARARDVNQVIEPSGYALPTNLVVESATWAGMVGVGAHGSGRDEQTLSDLVEIIELVDGTGTLRRFEVDVDPAEVMNAVRVSLGLFGIIHRLTIRVVPSFHVRHDNRFLTQDQLLADLPRLVNENEYLDLYWTPFTETVWVRSWNRTSEPRTPRPRQRPWSGLSDRSHWGLWISWLQTVALAPMDWLTRVAPSTSPLVCRARMALTAPDTRVITIQEATHFRASADNIVVGCAEFAFSVDPSFEGVRRGWAALVREVDAFAARGRYPLTMVANARFVRNSDCLLSPAHGNERTCYIEVLGDTRRPDWRPFVTAVAAEWMKLPNARPHWGKEFSFIPSIVRHTRAVLGADLERFLALRRELGVDPDGLFVNPFLEKLLFSETES